MRIGGLDNQQGSTIYSEQQLFILVVVRSSLLALRGTSQLTQLQDLCTRRPSSCPSLHAYATHNALVTPHSHVVP